MSTDSPPPLPKKGFFRRLSLSASKAGPSTAALGVGAGAGAGPGANGAPPLPPGARSAGRAVSTPVGNIGGPAYESLPPARGKSRERGAAAAAAAGYAGQASYAGQSSYAGQASYANGHAHAHGHGHGSPRSPPPGPARSLGVPPVPPVPSLPPLPPLPSVSGMAGPYPTLSTPPTAPTPAFSPPAAYRSPPSAYAASPPAGAGPPHARTHMARVPSIGERQRNPIVPALASPPTSPPREQRSPPARPPVRTSPARAPPARATPIAAAMARPDTGPAQPAFGAAVGRFPLPASGVAQSWSRPPLLGQEPPGMASSGRPNGEAQRQSSSAPSRSYEIIASSHRAGTQTAQSNAPGPARTSSMAQGGTFASAPAARAAPAPDGAAPRIAPSTSMNRFEDAESATPPPPASARSPRANAAAPAPGPQVRTSSRRSSSQNRGQRAVVTAAPGHATQAAARPEVESLEPAALGAMPTRPPTSSGSLAEHARAALAASAAFEAQPSTRPRAPEAGPAQAPTSASPAAQPEKRLSRPLPRPPSVALSPTQQTATQQTAPPPYSPVGSSPTSPVSRTSAATTTRPSSTTAATSPRSSTVHVIASTAVPQKHSDSGALAGPAESRGLMADRAVAANGQARPRISIPNSQAVRPPPPASYSNGSSPAAVSAMPPARGAAEPSHAARPPVAKSRASAVLSPNTADRRVSQIQRDSPDLTFDFPRSPTLPPLVDPRAGERRGPQPSPLSPAAQQSPTISVEAARDPIDRWAHEARSPPPPPKQQVTRKPTLENLSPVLPSSQLPPRVSSAQGRRIASSPLSSPVFTSPAQMSPSHAALQARSPQGGAGPAYPSPMAAPAPSRSASAAYPSRQGAVGLGIQDRQTSPRHSLARPPRSPSPSAAASLLAPPRVRPKRVSLLWLLGEPAVASCMLTFFSIDTFLSLLGSDKAMRGRFSADMVAKWVFAEWGITYDPDMTRSRPGMSTWEGFLYSTYSAQYNSLLEHLSLSHTQIVLYLRSLPASAFPYAAPQLFDDELGLPPPLSSSIGSLSAHLRPRSRLGSTAGSDNASIATGSVPGKMPRQERVMEIIMPEPLAPQVADSPEPARRGSLAPVGPPVLQKKGRRGSVGSIASTTSFAFGARRRASSTASVLKVEMAPPAARGTQMAAPMAASGKAALPPVSFPSAKRYGFRRGAESADARARNRSSMDSSRPGSIMSVQSSPSFGHGGPGRAPSAYSRQSFAVDRNAPPVPTLPPHLPVPPAIGGGGGSSNGGHRASFASSQDTRSKTSSPVGRRYGGGGDSPSQSTRDLAAAGMQQARPEPAFDRPPPYTLGRAPLLRVFVPQSADVPTWPSAEGAAACLRQLDKVGAVKRLRMGDLVVNTAIRQPKNTEHVLVFVPNNRHLLLPLSYAHSATGHLPRIVDGLALPPSYYYPFLPAPQIVFLDLAAYAARGIGSIRLAYDRRDVTVASGARLAAKRYLHVAGLEVGPGDRCAPEWHGLLSLEAEGTAEGKRDLEERLGWGQPARAVMGPWEVVRDKSMAGTIWLRLVKEQAR